MSRLSSLRIKGLLVLSLFTVLVSSLSAQQNITTRFFTAYTYEALAVDATAGGIAFTDSKVNPSGAAWNAQMVSVEILCASGTSCDSNFTVDGTTVTSSVGTTMYYNDVFTIYGHENIVAFRAIRTGATSASYRVTYYK